jgi:hypothetical protein
LECTKRPTANWGSFGFTPYHKKSFCVLEAEKKKKGSVLVPKYQHRTKKSYDKTVQAHEIFATLPQKGSSLLQRVGIAHVSLPPPLSSANNMIP